MTLPWYLNPWAEVRRLRAELAASEKASASWEGWARGRFDGASGLHEHIVVRKDAEICALRAENAELRQQIAEMERRPIPF